MNQKFELRKIRDFGEVINDTFVFTGQNWKPLLRAYAVICGFFIAGSLIVSTLNQLKMTGYINNGFTNAIHSGTSPFGAYGNNPFRMFGVEYFLAIIFSIFAFISIYLTTLCFVALYREKGNIAPNVEEVWSYFKFHFFRVMGSSLLLWLGLCIGFVLCIVPGFWILPAFCLVMPVMVFENTTLGYAFSRAFQLIKDNYWTTLGVIIVSGIITYIGMAVFILPLSILNASSLLFGEHKFNTTYLILTSIASHVCYMFYMLPTIAISISYFSLTEQKDNTGLMDRINSLGSNDQPLDQFPTEEY